MPPPSGGPGILPRAALPPTVCPARAGDLIVIDTVVTKYCDHTPLHRQSMILERDIGLEISRATLDGWVLKVGELLIPIVAAMSVDGSGTPPCDPQII
jgi:hypothetical protein